MPDLQLKNIQIEKLGPVNLTVNSGEITCLSGPSGAGKSLLLKAIVDILPHAGDAYLNSKAASKTSPPQWRKTVGLLPAESQWWFDTIGEHFKDRDDSLLKNLGFSPETWSWAVSRCSTGEKQRLALLRLLANKPECLLLDEPTGSLDPDNTEMVERLINRYAQENNAPVIWVSHSREQLARICSQHYLVDNGELIKQ